MRTTTDLYTGKPFRWNEVVVVEHDGNDVVVPARLTKTTFTHLHPARVPADLLAELNNEGWRDEDTGRYRVDLAAYDRSDPTPPDEEGP